ncbi:MAG: cyclase [Anaerolineae bacterium]|nr:cyclase [Anaerolineae bacterium]
MGKQIEFTTLLPAPVEVVQQFHANPQALRQLTPPPLIMQIVRDDRASPTQGELEFRLWMGPIPIRWIAQHAPGPNEYSFTDHMLAGPMVQWQHQHIFEPEGDQTRLTDRITLTHKPGIAGLFTRLFFDGLPLRFLFWFRHWYTKRAVKG